MKNTTIERETLWRVVETEWVDDEGFTVVDCDVYQDGVYVSGASESLKSLHPLKPIAVKRVRQVALEQAGVFE